MKRNIIETVLGGVVLAVAAVFIVFAYTSADMRATGGYEVTAQFSSIDGLARGSDVRISGVKVGTVVSQRLDPETYLAEVRMNLDESVELPADTVAVVASESLLGGRYLRLDIGGDLDLISPGGRLQYTQSTPGLEQLIGQAIYGLQGGGNGGSGPARDAPPANGDDGDDPPAGGMFGD